MLSFVRLGCPFSVSRVILLSLLISFWTLLVISCLRSLIWIVGHLLLEEALSGSSLITGLDLQEVARPKKSTAGGLDGWAWNEIKALPLPWFSGLAILVKFG